MAYGAIGGDDTAQTFAKLSGAVARALICQMTAEEVCLNFDQTFQQAPRVREDLIARLRVCCEKAPLDVEHPRALVAELVGPAEERIAPLKRQSLEYAIKELVDLLPVEEQTAFATRYLTHHRYRRRLTAYKIVRSHFRPEHPELLRESIATYSDPVAVETLLRVDADITDIAEQLLTYYEHPYDESRQEYMRSLVFSKIVQQDLQQAIELASVYPMNFVRGSGWVYCHAALPTVQTIYQEHKADTELLGIFIWVFGRLGGKAELRELATVYDGYVCSFPALAL